jgi:hypothetical protein
MIMARRMNLTKQLNFGVLSLAVLFVTACGGAGNPSGTSEIPAVSPGDEVQAFYDWYLDYPDNVFAEGVYKEHAALDQSFVQNLEEKAETLNCDPFGCAQDRIGTAHVEYERIEGEEAEVGVRDDFGRLITVKMIWHESEWAIDAIQCPSP